MLWGARKRFIDPCLPSRAERPPAGPDWIHEIKHDGSRIMARRDGAGVRLFTRKDFAARFPLATAAVAALPAHSFLIDGEAIVTDDSGASSSPPIFFSLAFHRWRSRILNLEPMRRTAGAIG